MFIAYLLELKIVNLVFFFFIYFYILDLELEYNITYDYYKLLHNIILYHIHYMSQPQSHNQYII